MKRQGADRKGIPIRVRTSALAAASVFVILAVSGCAASAPPTGEQAAGETAGAAAAGHDSTVAYAASGPQLPVGVIGTAHVTAADGARLGVVELVADGTDEIEVRLSGLTPQPENPRQIMFAPIALADGQTCFDTGVRFDLGSPDSPDGWSGVLYTGGEMVGDPSFFDEVVFTTGRDIANATEPLGCLADVVGRSVIEWTFEPLRGDLRVVDSGATGGARGEVELSEGQPMSYTVAGNDLIDEVAARFGITRDDLFYLNPTRIPAPMSVTLSVGEVLNLSVARR
jgi:hypothetical protein